MELWCKGPSSDEDLARIIDHNLRFSQTPGVCKCYPDLFLLTELYMYL